MTRDLTASPNRVALLATGDEITNGDILNSNSQVIAQQLFKHGMQPGIHMTVPDHLSEIENAISHLLQTHRALIITGGLGPTSDDITRYALSKALNCPLIFNDRVWDAICERFKLLGYQGTPPEGNRQQALFPESAVIISNLNGTAAGCALQQGEKIVFMLPGPPFECLPMVESTVLPTLKQLGLQEILYFDHWLLFGASEGEIAEKLDALAKPFACMTGYRLFYPYIEFKIYSNHQNDFDTLCGLVKKTIEPYLISDSKKTASETLRETCENLTEKLTIRDVATGGLLENMLKTPRNAHTLDFYSHHSPNIEIKGLEEFWQGKDVNTTHLEIKFTHPRVQEKIQKDISFRGRGNRIKQYAVEFICYQINNFLTKVGIATS